MLRNELGQFILGVAIGLNMLAILGYTVYCGLQTYKQYKRLKRRIVQRGGHWDYPGN